MNSDTSFAGKIHNAIQELRRLKIGILGMSEIRWYNSGEISIRHTEFTVLWEEQPR